MELFVKHFSELTAQELYEIYRLRVSVFVVEQECCYQEVDDADENAYHVWLRDKDGIEAYARVLPRGATFPEVSIGRVIVWGSKSSPRPSTRRKRSCAPIRSRSKRRRM